MMELPGSRIPWLRAVGAAGAVVALVVGGAVTTAGAIDDPGGAEPAKVQVVATDGDGNWFSCDIQADLDAGLAGEGVAMAISASAEVPGAPEGVPDGATYNMVMGATGTAEGVPEGAIEIQSGEGGVIVAEGEAVASAASGASAGGGGAVAGPMTPGTEAGMIIELPEPSDVRPGTPDECGALNVTVGEAVLPTPGAPADPTTGATGAKATGSEE